MFVYPFEMVTGHVVLDLGSHFFLLDTGSPSSIGAGSITIGERIYPVKDCIMGITAEYLTREIGCRIDGLIGSDIISCPRHD